MPAELTQLLDPPAPAALAAPLAVIETHPVQYHAPVYRRLQSHHGVPVTAIYGSDFSVAGYRDREFAATFQWDTDLLSGYSSTFLRTVAAGAARTSDAVAARGLHAAIRAAAPGAILLTGYSPRFHRAACIAALRSRRPVILRAETTDHTRPRAAAHSRIRDAALRLLYRSCSRLLYVGERSRDHFRRLGVPEGKLIFSPYCVDTSAFDCSEAVRPQLRRAARAQLGIPADATVLLFSGKLSPRKAPDLLLQAVRMLAEKPAVVFLGSGELQHTLQRAAAASGINAHFPGFQNQTQLSPYYHAADLLVLPSLHSETWGLVVNEALHHGLPCVVSNAVGCAPDLIDPSVTGEIAVAGSADSLAAAIHRALALINRPALREQCRQKVAAYSLENGALGIAKAYRAVVARA